MVARVVVAEDEAVALAVLGVAVGTVGAHPDPVAEAAAVDDPADGAAGSGREERQRQGSRRAATSPARAQFSAFGIFAATDSPVRVAACSATV